MMTRFRSRLLGALGAMTVAATLTVAPAALVAAEETPPDDGLAQVIDPNQAQGTGRVVLNDGHIDFGPTLNTGEWIVQIHDDTSYPSYWRMLDDVVAQVNDGSKLTVPDNEAYAFLGLEPGTEAWVIPQVREPGVIWAGWNTQEPGVLEALNMGTTLSILGVDGPGDVTVYLQSGNFGDPEQLWSTHEPFPQESWIEVNTHTHANWVFSDPGVYLVEVQFSGELADGSTVSAHDTLRFAVGDETDPESAFDVEIAEDAVADAGEAGDSDEPAETAAEEPAEGSGLTGIVIGLVAGLVGAALVIGVIAVLIASARAKARAKAEARRRAAERRDGRTAEDPGEEQ